MALFDTTWYINDGDNSTTGWWAVGTWNNNGGAGRAWTAGQIVRQSGTPTVGNERCYICIVAGTGGTGADPLTTFTRGVKITDAGATWQECTGASAVNGDVTNTPVWTAATAYTLGQIIKRVNAASYWICSTAGTSGASEPAWANNTAGTTRTDGAGALVWTCLGVVGNFTGWQAPHARLASAFTATWGASGNTFYVANGHAETQSTAMTLTSPNNGGSGSGNCFIYCVNSAGSLPPVSADLLTTATISTTGNSAMTFANQAYYYGIIFSCGNGSNAPQLTVGNGTGLIRMDSCALRSGGTNSSQIRICNSTIAVVDLLNTTIQFAATGSVIQTGQGYWRWRGSSSSITGATLPTNLVTAYNSVAGILFDGIDLSALGSGKTLFANQQSTGLVTLNECKLGASVTVSTNTGFAAGHRVNVINCDSGATNYRHEQYQYGGTLTIETTIVRTSGATDGTTPIAWKIVATGNSSWTRPFESFPITIWNDSTSAITTLTLYGTTTGGGVPNNDDIWVEAEYLGSGSTPLGSIVTSSKADNLAASATTNNSSDASTWGGSGAGNGFKIVVPSFTPGQKGPITIVVKVAKASATYYVDPRPSITNVQVSKSAVLFPGAYANELVSSPAQLINSQGLVG